MRDDEIAAIEQFGSDVDGVGLVFDVYGEGANGGWGIIEDRVTE